MVDLAAHAPLARHERPAADAAAPEGLLVLLHGRGANRDDLVPLLDMLDPDRRLHAVTLEAPFTPSGHVGHHWYIVERVGFPDERTFLTSYALLVRDVDALLAEHGLGAERLVLGGFSQGSVMATALATGPGRPRIAMLWANSGFVPVVDGWNVDAGAAAQLPVLLTHGMIDNVISPGFADTARELLLAAGAQVELHKPPIAHQVAPAAVLRARDLVAKYVPRPVSPGPAGASPAP